MTHKQIYDMLAGSNLPVAYYAFPENQAPDLPYIVYFFTSNDDVIADNTNYVEIVQLNIELYTQNKDFAKEDALESILKSNHIVYSKESAYVNSEHMYQTAYESEVIING